MNRGGIVVTEKHGAFTVFSVFSPPLRFKKYNYTTINSYHFYFAIIIPTFASILYSIIKVNSLRDESIQIWWRLG
jgi:hypothetical protein